MDIPAFFAEHWRTLLIPVISAVVGWFTNVVAVKMMFYPTDFVGIPPYLGWQGIVPANARRLAQYSTRLITTKLLSLDELFADFQPENFGESNLGPVIDDITEQVIQEVAEKHAPEMWKNAGEFMQNKAREVLRGEVEQVLVQISGDLSDNINEILDLEQVVVDAVMEDRRIMSRMFLEVGEAEFKFIEISGLYFGFLFGLIQMAVWIFFPADWVLPGFGFFVGYATNWIAIKLIFEPREPKKIGPIVIHGLFHKRQQEVSTRFASLTAGRVLNAENIVKTVTEGETGERVMGIVETRIGALISKYEAHPMAAMALPEDQRGPLREALLGRIKEELPKDGGMLHVFAGKAVDIRESLEERMKKLDAESFEGVLRPAFQQDEWKLIVAGAVLGFLAGVGQLVWLFGETLAS